MISGVHSSLHLNSCHQIVFAKFDLKIFYPPPYKCEIFHYSKGNTDLTCWSINKFSWEKRFSKTDANQKAYLFNKAIKNILSNFIPHDTIIWDDHDPPWINSKIKIWTWKKISLTSAFSKRTVIFNYFRRFQSLQNLFTVTIKKSKQQFYSWTLNKLMNTDTSPKAYWSILKMFLNSKRYLVFHQFIIIIIIK